jgi:hypothetical protein
VKAIEITVKARVIVSAGALVTTDWEKSFYTECMRKAIRDRHSNSYIDSVSVEVSPQDLEITEP